jgi:hypothetical protein
MALKGSLNLGLSEELKTNFPDIRKIERPLLHLRNEKQMLVINKKNMDPN